MVGPLIRLLSIVTHAAHSGIAPPGVEAVYPAAPRVSACAG